MWDAKRHLPPNFILFSDSIQVSTYPDVIANIMINLIIYEIALIFGVYWCEFGFTIRIILNAQFI